MAAVIDTQPSQTVPAVNEESLVKLIQALAQSGESDSMVMRAVIELVEDGAIRLSGGFRGMPLAIVRNALLFQS